MKTIRRALILCAFILGLGLLYAGPAFADSHVCISGYADPTSQGLANVKAEQGYPCDVPVQWPADIGLPGDQTNIQGSLNVAVPAAVDAYYRAGGGNGVPVTIEGWSLGTIAASQSGDAIRIQNGGVIPPNLTVVTDGNVYGDSGMANDPGIAGLAFHTVAPFFGAPQNVPQMGINRGDINDGWHDSAHQLPQTQIADISTVGQNHRIPNPAEKHDTYITKGVAGPVVNEVYGVGENPITAAANVNGTPIPPPVDAFFDVTFPVNNPANSARLATPSFFGELPCPGGYFTAGNAPC